MLWLSGNAVPTANPAGQHIVHGSPHADQAVATCLGDVVAAEIFHRMGRTASDGDRGLLVGSASTS